MIDATRPQKKAQFGIPGLDDVTSGGLAEGHLFLLEGSPGTGKTTIALQFLLRGAHYSLFSAESPPLTSSWMVCC